MFLFDILLAILAIFLPPLPVLLKTGCSFHFFLNICLTLFFWIPGVLHAWYIIFTYGSRRVYM